MLLKLAGIVVVNQVEVVVVKVVGTMETPAILYVRRLIPQEAVLLRQHVSLNHQVRPVNKSREIVKRRFVLVRPHSMLAMCPQRNVEYAIRKLKALISMKRNRLRNRNPMTVKNSYVVETLIQ